MKLIRKFSAPLTLVTLLSAAYAAPYLLPADPDSAVFRSGVLGLILLFACAAPVTSALRTQSMRALVYGTAFGFAFAAALSLGSELAFYDRLLPGMGSMIRRLCVPVMITPLSARSRRICSPSRRPPRSRTAAAFRSFISSPRLRFAMRSFCWPFIRALCAMTLSMKSASTRPARSRRRIPCSTRSSWVRSTVWARRYLAA